MSTLHDYVLGYFAETYNTIVDARKLLNLRISLLSNSGAGLLMKDTLKKQRDSLHTKATRHRPFTKNDFKEAFLLNYFGNCGLQYESIDKLLDQVYFLLLDFINNLLNVFVGDEVTDRANSRQKARVTYDQKTIRYFSSSHCVLS